ncbi:tRNA uridine-5-carboxymethylaminomethyl(34) synthesis GTPase MnmE [Qipengyuania sp. XHP0207]|uniref:tRNA uridine-5-carboxymethylaminomethyl(34) synthesis GTPase MnmE n=1 Tax=Qipengyuania sp. XHP0207 TaxID=3038078 RepID=UPI00241DF5EF|nr:tRNA uridine-5-carboxymethylaminomethyl(34) synthesis GTPase MnmE [Qipengyuania sp. XHP0207]MDG5748093.1 tRNA uridine-5-carboxymethylaminomethyl(34) synthesis GTPase MnmE [Qipengyuania sp. XHP0207]
MTDTIYALSSGAPPAGIAIIRISGPFAGEALSRLAGKRPRARHAALRTLRAADGSVLDQALVLWFPGPATASGEDMAELHCHGGRAVVEAVLAELGRLEGFREAQPGEFTRRAFANGRIDLAEVEGLGDLLAAETEWQRRGAIAAAGGELSRRIEQWRGEVLGLSAKLEAVIDFSDEDDVSQLPADFSGQLAALAGAIEEIIARPPLERLKDGVRVVFAGPPNAGKSSLFNAILKEGVAIVSAEAGTTRDVIERPIALGGAPFVLVDTAGLRDEGASAIEAIGVDRAKQQMASADILLWLGPADMAPEGAHLVQSKSDLLAEMQVADHVVSSVTGEGLDDLVDWLVATAAGLLPPLDRLALNRRQRALARECAVHLRSAEGQSDPLLAAEDLRLARLALDSISGRSSTEDMLDALFGQFCIGK